MLRLPGPESQFSPLRTTSSHHLRTPYYAKQAFSMSRSSTLGIVTAIFLGLTWITLFVRCWVRVKLVKIFGIDDKWMVAAQVRILPQL
jgi:hypothetical protein